MISKMEHTAIIVSDMDRSIAYYESMFGFKVRLRGENNTREMAFLYLEQQPGMEIELIRDIDPTMSYSSTGLVNHLAFTVQNIEEAIFQFREKGIEFLSQEPNPTLEGGRMILFHGPNGELLQLVERAQ
ncbi:VOC family protein [Bacillus thermotolerans]|uniref:Lactoylglutathione lyase n=1 Tax=Bacillus thermotolerans TaxID=1221996 RepID=A0A0F5I0U9_BACTR|nr:VOC family protein [Bacillus thermotolerans]KKB39133.1 Lactoylglutathione lyase [Bacillus thermotolerans]KKB41580.1 Lactoylglutathione lyase [Bacillus thermotolerans]KKB42753.1 Lactoylglutathione lyase [Bacillus thermotolerans]